MTRLILLVVSMTAQGCASTADFPSIVGEVSHDLETEAVALETGCGDEASDALTLRGAELRDRTLLLDVAHPGGCTEHTYRVCGAREVLETEPGQWVLTVLHDANGDTCATAQHRVLAVHLDRQTPVGLRGPHERTVTVWVR